MSDHEDDVRLPDRDTLDRYLAGECSPAEEEAVRRALGGDPRARVHDALAHADAARDWQTARAWRSVRSRMRTPTPQWRVWVSRPATLRIAASLLLLVGAAAVTREVVSRNERAAEANATREVATAVGERRDVTLPDGSRVTLAPESRLRYPARFAGRRRDVHLAGEAFFAVAPNQERPFSVRAAGAVARVLGTEFAVRARQGESAVDVVVATGRVQVHSAADSAGPVLAPGDLGRVDTGTRAVTVRRGVPLEQHLGWRAGRLHVVRRPLGDLAPELARWFGVRLVVPDPALAARPVTADLRVGEGASLDVLLDALALALDARYTRAGRTITMVDR